MIKPLIGNDGNPSVASLALTDYLKPLLADSRNLQEVSIQLPFRLPGRLGRVAALNRAIVVMSVSAWEAYVEELVRESLNALRPPIPPLGLWPALNASIRGQLGRFNNPNTENVRMLLSDAIGLANISASWTWQNHTSAQTIQRLRVVMDLRHQIAHGVKPRPVVATSYASQLPDFLLRLGRCTDRAVQDHLVEVLGVANPWPL